MPKFSPSSLPQGARSLPLPAIMDTGGSGQIRDISGSYWWSALQPVTPSTPRDTRVRQWEFQPGANLIWQPGATDTGAAGFWVLRQIADNWDLLRLVIETVKDRLCSVKWDIRLKAEPGETNKNLKARTANDDRVKQLKDFFSCPDGLQSWDDWLRMIIEDMLVLDAACIYLERDTSGKIAMLKPIDGATINRQLTDQGFTPPPPSVAYQQVLYGVPAVNLTTDDLIYAMRNPRTNRRYGFSCVEQCLNTIAIGLRRQEFQLAYYTSGSMPEAMVFLPAELPGDKIKEAQEWFDSILAGDLQKRRRVTFLPGYGTKDSFKPNVVFPKEVLLKDEMDDWLMKIVCFNLGISPQSLIKQMNRASAQQSVESAEEEGLEPKLRWIENFVNVIIQQRMAFKDIEFAYEQRRETDALKQMQIDTGYATKAIRTLNEVRENLGEDPYDIPEANEPGFLLPTGWTPLTGSMDAAQSARDLAANPPAPKPVVAGKDDKKPPAEVTKTWASCPEHFYIDMDCAPCVDAELARVSKAMGLLSTIQKRALTDGGHKSGNGNGNGHAVQKFKQPKTISATHQTPALKAAQAKLEAVSRKVFRRQREKAGHAAGQMLKSVAKANTGDDDFDPAKFADDLYAVIEPDFLDMVPEVQSALEEASGQGISKGIMDLQISDTGLIGSLNESAMDWAADRAAEMVGMKWSDGLDMYDFVKESRGGNADNILVTVDVKKLDAAWSKDGSYYIPPGGPTGAAGESSYVARYKGFQQWLIDHPDTPIESPYVGYMDGVASFNNGRHRFAVLRDQGETAVQIEIEPQQKKIFEALFAPDETDAILIPNPDAEWAITDVTRQELRDIIMKAFAEETPVPDLIEEIKDATSFSDYRAEMVARTEVQRAQVEANYDVWRKSGLVEKVQWLLSENHEQPCECDENDDEIVGIDEAFPSGDLMPPAHPGCECVVMTVEAEESEGQAQDEEEGAAVEDEE